MFTTIFYETDVIWFGRTSKHKPNFYNLGWNRLINEKKYFSETMSFNESPNAYVDKGLDQFDHREAGKNLDPKLMDVNSSLQVE